MFQSSLAAPSSEVPAEDEMEATMDGEGDAPAAKIDVKKEKEIKVTENSTAVKIVSF